MRVAAVQMESIPGRPAENLASAEERIRSAAGEGATLVALPECALNGYDIEWFRTGAPGSAPYPGQIFDHLARLSGELGIAIAIADLEIGHGGLYDTGFIFDGGNLVSRHRKTTPTDREVAAGILAGNAPAAPISLSGSSVMSAPMVCYEYAFPEIALHLAEAGAQLLVVSSAIRRGFEYLIPVRLRARAQDNACYVVMANAVGSASCGRSVIVNPLGDIIAEASGSVAETIVADIDETLTWSARPNAVPSIEEHRALQLTLQRGGADADTVGADGDFFITPPSSTTRFE